MTENLLTEIRNYLSKKDLRSKHSSTSFVSGYRYRSYRVKVAFDTFEFEGKAKISGSLELTNERDQHIRQEFFITDADHLMSLIHSNEFKVLIDKKLSFLADSLEGEN